MIFFFAIANANESALTVNEAGMGDAISNGNMNAEVKNEAGNGDAIANGNMNADVENVNVGFVENGDHGANAAFENDPNEHDKSSDSVIFMGKMTVLQNDGHVKTESMNVSTLCKGVSSMAIGNSDGTCISLYSFFKNFQLFFTCVHVFSES